MKIQLEITEPKISPAKDWKLTEMFSVVEIDHTDIMFYHYASDDISQKDLAKLISLTMIKHDGLWIRQKDGLVFTNKISIHRIKLKD